MELITKLKKNGVFVFGSNLNGNHAGGAALQAKESFGAEEGVGEGLTGQCYAFPTLDKQMRKVSREDLIRSRKKLYEIALENPKKEFLLTKIGCGIAGFDEEFMKDVFCQCDIPSNIILPEGWFPRRWKFVLEKEGKMVASQNDFEWTIGDWKHQRGTIKLCEKGFHCSVNPLDALNYVKGSKVLLVECQGKSDTHSDKEAWSDMRAIEAYDWTSEMSVRLSIFAAEKVLDVYEEYYHSDKRPREAIEAAKKCLEDPNTWATEAAWATRAAEATRAARAAEAAARAAWAAARAARAAARAAEAAAWATRAAEAAAWATRAAWAAWAAARAAEDRDLLLEEINEYMVKLIRDQNENKNS